MKKATYNMDAVEVGKRIAIVRDEVLSMTQKELAPLINTEQTLLSRLERGIGGTLHIVVYFINYLNNNGYNGHMLFREPFEINLFKADVLEINKAKLSNEIDSLKLQSDTTSEKISELKQYFK